MTETESDALKPDLIPAANKPASERFLSVDAVRGLTILLMIFVNDIGKAAPAWMHHIQPSNADGMTLADIVFPSFLFIVGISIPLATERAMQLGKSIWKILFHILTRTFGLLTMGMIELNGRADVTLGGSVWVMLSFIAIVLAWSVIPRTPGLRRKIFIALKSLGVVGIIVLLAIYRREPVATNVLFVGQVESWTWLRTQWWGILGLIGWAYLTGSVVYLALRTRREWLMGAMFLLLVVHLAFAGGGLFSRVDDKSWIGPFRALIHYLELTVAFLSRYIGLGTATGSLASIVVAGSLLGATFTGPNKLSDQVARFRWALMFALGLFMAGLVFDNFGGINKIGGTPTWCLWCSALTCAVWAIVDRTMHAGFTKWSIIVSPAGANPLIAYLLHPVLLSAITLLGLWNPLLSYKNSESPAVVIIGSLVMSLIICGSTGLIAKLGLRVRI